LELKYFSISNSSIWFASVADQVVLLKGNTWLSHSSSSLFALIKVRL